MAVKNLKKLNQHTFEKEKEYAHAKTSFGYERCV